MQGAVLWHAATCCAMLYFAVYTALPGFTAILLQLSLANWIINYPIVSPFAGNWRIGELGGGERGGKRGGVGG